MDDLPVLSFTDLTLAETGSPFMEFQARLSAPTTTDVTFTARTIGGTAVLEDDTFGPVNDVFTIPAGTTTLTVPQRLFNDGADEGDESLYLRISDVTGAVLEDGNATTLVRGIILDDDGDTRPALFVDDAEIVEGGGAREAVFAIALSRPFAEAVTIPYETVGISATAGQDFTSTAGSVTFAPGETEAEVRVPVAGDTAVEPSETFGLALDVSGIAGRLSNGAEAALGTATILDDDAGGGVLPVISVGDVRILEAGSPFVAFDVRLSAPTTADVRLDAYAFDDTTLAADDLFDLVSDEIVIPAGQTSVEIFQRIFNDGRAEPAESFQLRLANPDGAVFAGGARELTARGIVLDDDDGPGRPSLFVDDVVLTEGNAGSREAEFGIALSAPLGEALTLDWRTVPLGGVGGQDFAPGSGTVTFVPGQTEASVAIEVFGDTTAEASERFALVVDVDGADIGNGAEAAVGLATILDDDSGGGTLPVLTVSDWGIDETGSQFAGYEFRLSAPTTTDVSFDVLTLDRTAFAEDDAFGQLRERITIEAGDTTARVFQRVFNDGADEGDEALALTVSNLTGAVFAGGGLETRALGVIRDDDGEARPALFVDDAHVIEGGSGQRSVQVDVTMSRPLDEPVAVTYTTAPRDGADLGDLAGRTGQLVFAPGETVKTVSFPVAGDTEIEPTGTLEVIVVPETAGVFSDGGNGAVGTVRLLDDDAGGGTLPVISVDGATRSESSSPFLPFEIRLSAPASTDVSFDARAVGETATGGEDTFRLVDERVTIPAGETAVTVFQRLSDDREVEETETFRLEISNLSGAVLEGGATVIEATAQILDDDGSGGTLTALLVDNVVIEEPDGGSATAVFEVRSPVPAGLTISGSYEVIAGTAAPGTDFEPMTGTFSIGSGSFSTQIAVPVFDDMVAEGDESVVLRLFDIVNAGSGNRSGEIHAIATIEDGPHAEDDAGTGFTRASVLIDPLGNDREGDGGALSVTAVSRPANGFAGVTADGEIVYRSRGGFEGEDSFVYTVTDAAGRTDTATVTLDVSAEPARDGLATSEAQLIAYVYEAGLDRDGNIDEPGLNFWIRAREGSLPSGAAPFSRERIAEAFLDSPEFAGAFGDPDTLSDEEFVTALYQNVLDREADEGGLAFWLSVLDQPDVNRPGLLLAFAGSAENLTGSPSVATLELGEDGLWAFG